MSIPSAGDRIGALPLRVVAEIGFTVFVIYLLSGGPHGWLGDAAAASGSSVEGNPRLQGLLALLYLTSLLIGLTRPRTWIRAAKSDLALVALIGLTLASVIWSEAPDLTLVRGLALLGTSFFGVYFALRYPPESQLRLLCLGLGLVVIYNAILALTQLGVVSAGSFRGSFDHKNSLAKMMTLATAAFLCAAGERRGRLLAVMLATVSFSLVVFAGSATGLVVVLTLVAIFPFLRLLRADVRLVVVLGIAAVLVLGIGALAVPQVVALLAPALGRDVTLTGRTEVWPVLIAMFLQRPWLGYGYSAFWSGDSTLGTSWQPTQAHNGFLEVALALGLVGLVIFVVMYARGVMRALLLVRREGQAASFWPLMYFGYVLLYNITEATVLGRNNILWVLFVSGLITVSPGWHRGGGSRARIAGRARSRDPRALASSREPVTPICDYGGNA